MTPNGRTRPFPGAWPSRPCSLPRTPSRVRIPGPSPLRSLYSARKIPDLPAGRGSACSVRRQLVLFIAACSSGAHCHLNLPSPALPARPSVHLARQVPAAKDRDRKSRGTRPPWHPAATPAGAGPAGSLSGAGLWPGTPGRDAGKHPGQATASSRQGLSRHLPPPGEASRTWPHGFRIPRMSGSVTPANLAMRTALAVPPSSLQCRRICGTWHSTADPLGPASAGRR